MNRIQGIINAVQSDGQLTVVEVHSGDDRFWGLIVDESDRRARPGTAVDLLFKEADTAIALNETIPISCLNRLPGPITSIVPGMAATRVTIDRHGGPISSLILTKSARSLDLRIGMRVTCFVKSTSIMLDYGETYAD